MSEVIRLNIDDVRSFNFPVGEMHVQIDPLLLEDLSKLKHADRMVDLFYNFSGNESVLKLSLVAHTLRLNYISVRNLFIPYVPFSREDRSFEPGGSFALAWFAGIVNEIKARNVIVIDPHSDVVQKYIDRCNVIEQHDVFSGYLYSKENFILVAPDKGALPKIKKLAECEGIKPLGILHFEKERELSTGKIIGHRPLDWKESYLNLPFYVVDDICDGGATPVSVCKAIKQLSPNSKIILMFSHGFFTRGLSVFDFLADEIYTKDGRVK